MASWLKAAEDLFEVVDRRAKLVVNELADEQTDSPVPIASNVQGSKTKRNKSRAKANRRPPADCLPKTEDTAQEHNTTLPYLLDVKPDKDTASTVLENNGSLSANPVVQTNDQSYAVDKDAPILGGSLTEKAVDSVERCDTDHVEVPVAQTISKPEDSSPNPNVGFSPENAADMGAGDPLPPLRSNGIEKVDRDSSNKEPNIPLNIEQERSQSESMDVRVESEGQLKDVEQKVESFADTMESAADKTQVESSADKTQVESSADIKQQTKQKADVSPIKLQDPLDEAQVLLRNSTSTGQSKEARLSRVCNGLATRLQEYKSENAQLEELLVAERELTRSYEARIMQLQTDLFVSKKEITRVESGTAEAMAAKNSEIEALSNSVEALKKQLALSEGNLASLQANMESLMRNRELSETRMMQALREELSSAERRAEEERTAHNATKKAAMEREMELEHRALEASTALARTQRLADERTAKAAELEQKLAFYEVENSSLTQELQDVKALARRGQKKSPEETNQVIQMQAWQEEAERARQGQRDAESKLSTLEVEMQKIRVEMAAMKRDAEHYSRQEHMELEKRYRELTDLLYYKQTQLEAMASEKAAAEFQLEKELKRIQEVQVEVERSRVSRRVSSSWEEDSELKALEPLPLHHRHMAAASLQLQRAAKLLDSGAVRATRFLWRYPTARVLLLFYLVFVHLFLMYLLHRLQEQADTFSAREVAESMGLANPNLP